MNSESRHLSRRKFCALGMASLGTVTLGRVASLADNELGGGWRADQGVGTYLNPILPGDHPDPGAIRVGNDFYLTHSSFQYTPGLPIWHSQDLVSWTHVTSVLKRYYGDIWAPYLCEHQGHFYVYFPDNGALHVCHAPSPLGPWSDPVDLHVQGIDPAHIATPEGRRYLHFSMGRMVELSADGLSAQGQPRKVFNAWPIPSDWRIECQCLEAPKIFWKDGFYYLNVAEGGTAGPATSHMVISARSRNVDGPWEYSPYNPIVHTKDRSEKWWSQGHARLVDTPDGSWWMTYHGYENGYRTLGRQTLLLPVEWTSDGWFRVPAGINAGQPIRKPQGTAITSPFVVSDDFTSSELKPQWQFWKEFGEGNYQAGDGRLVLTPTGPSLENTPLMSFATGDHAYTVEVDVEAEPSCTAGLILFYDPLHACGVSVGPQPLEHRAGMGNTFVFGVHAQQATLRLVNDRQEMDTYYKIPGEEWRRMERSFDVSGLNQNVLGGFLSLRPAVFACGSGNATFRAFRYSANVSAPSM
jgi:xylan 1,4-beta-xylosidase